MTDNWRQTRSWQKKTSVIHECTSLEFTHKMHYGDVSAGARLSLDKQRCSNYRKYPKSLLSFCGIHSNKITHVVLRSLAALRLVKMGRLIFPRKEIAAAHLEKKKKEPEFKVICQIMNDNLADTEFRAVYQSKNQT